MNKEIDKILREFLEKLPKFPDGRIDYSNSDKVAVLTCFVKFKDKILLLKRSKKVGVYKLKWNTIAGYIDELKSIRKKVLEELKEEIGVLQKDIQEIKIKESYEFFDSDIKKAWIIYPAIVELKKKPKIRLDWEHTEFKWIFSEEIMKYDIVPKLDESLKRVLVK